MPTRGPAAKRILEREFGAYSQAAYQRLAGISVVQIYRFRNSESYRKHNTSYQPTRPTPIPIIGQRRKPRPQGRTECPRIDTVHQGDRDRRQRRPDAGRELRADSSVPDWIRRAMSTRSRTRS